MSSWKCTGVGCGECEDSSKFDYYIQKPFIKFVYVYFKVFHSIKRETICVCRTCNRGITRDDVNYHLSKYHGRIPLTYASYTYSILCGKIRNVNTYINLMDLAKKHPQIMRLSLCGSIDNVVNEVDENLTANISGMREMNLIRDPALYEEICSAILKKLIVCADCGKIYDTVPTPQIVAEHRCGGHD